MEANHIAFRVLSKSEETVFTDGRFFLAYTPTKRGFAPWIARAQAWLAV